MYRRVAVAVLAIMMSSQLDAQVPRKGGVILAAGLPRLELEARLSLDPFQQKNLASYEVVEFVPRVVVPGLEALQA